MELVLFELGTENDQTDLMVVYVITLVRKIL